MSESQLPFSLANTLAIVKYVKRMHGELVAAFVGRELDTRASSDPVSVDGLRKLVALGKQYQGYRSAELSKVIASARMTS